MSATIGPSTTNCAQLTDREPIATRPRRCRGERRLVIVASRTSKHADCKQRALFAARACVRRLRLTTRVSDSLDDYEECVDEEDDPDLARPDSVVRLRDGARMFGKRAPAGHHDTMLGAIRVRKSRS